MKWTTAAPTVPGWYWCKVAPGEWCNYARPEAEAVYIWRQHGKGSDELRATSAFYYDNDLPLTDSVFAGRLWSDEPIPTIQDESAE